MASNYAGNQIDGIMPSQSFVTNSHLTFISSQSALAMSTSKTNQFTACGQIVEGWISAFGSDLDGFAVIVSLSGSQAQRHGGNSHRDFRYVSHCYPFLHCAVC